MNSLRILIALAAFVSLRGEADDCKQGPVGYLCGIESAEDMVAVPDSKWIVTSGLSVGNKPGKLYLIDRAQKTSSVLFPSDAVKSKHDAHTYPGCADAVASDSFSAHGLNLRRGSGGVHTLYVIGHGKREAVEVFELDASKRAPVLTWKGCVFLPHGTVANAVTPLANDEIAVTHMAVPEYFSDAEASTRLESWVEKFTAAQTTGYAARWSTAEGWKKVADTEASGPNGIEASADNQWLWVADWAEKKVVRVSLRGNAAREVLKMDFMPDNLRWGDDGQLWVAGATGTPASYFGCLAKPGCKNDYAIVKIDPKSLKLVRVSHPNTLPVFGDGTTALKVGSEVWIASTPSDRVGYMRD